jgi:Uncharacterized protein conserved in bacteria
MDFKEILYRAGLSQVDDAAAFLGVSRQTIYRYITHGAPVMALRALDFPAGTNPSYWGLSFRENGVWSGARRLLAVSEIVDIEWRLQREYLRGQIDGARSRSGQTGG